MTYMRKKTKEQMEWGANVPHAINARGESRPIKYLMTDKQRKERSDKGQKRKDTETIVRSVRIDAQLWAHLEQSKGEMSINAYINHLLRQAIGMDTQEGDAPSFCVEMRIGGELGRRSYVWSTYDVESGGAQNTDGKQGLSREAVEGLLVTLEDYCRQQKYFNVEFTIKEIGK